jgi:6-phosphogluconolactonase
MEIVESRACRSYDTMPSSLLKGDVPRICIAAEGDDWTEFAAGHIAAVVSFAVRDHGTCSMVLTGGATAERLYSHWGTTEGLPWGSMRFYFGDERCVPPDHPGSNCAMALRCLRGNHRRPELSVTRMAAEEVNVEAAARRYERELPERPDLLLLGVGRDGHIASLFPGDPALKERERRVVPVVSGAEFGCRLTITPTVIAAARSIFLLATGAEKGRVLAEALRSPADFQTLPVRLAMKGTWLLDHEAGSALQGTKS